VRRLPSVDVVVDTGALARNDSGTIAGPIWLRDGDPDVQADFPEVGWVDLPLAVLASWVQELQRLTRTLPSSSGTEVACRFLDGPYYFTVRVESASGWLVRCFETREHPASDELVQEWKTGSSAFLASAVRAGRAVLAQCDARGCWSRETESLRRCLESGSQYRSG
jgi:hypothetical protein